MEEVWELAGEGKRWWFRAPSFVGFAQSLVTCNKVKQERVGKVYHVSDMLKDG